MAIAYSILFWTRKWVVAMTRHSSLFGTIPSPLVWDWGGVAMIIYPRRLLWETGGSGAMSTHQIPLGSSDPSYGNKGSAGVHAMATPTSLGH